MTKLKLTEHYNVNKLLTSHFMTTTRLLDNYDLAAKTFDRTLHQFRTFLFVMPYIQSGIVFLKLLFLT